jgi:hypothetical protein
MSCAASAIGVNHGTNANDPSRAVVEGDDHGLVDQLVAARPEPGAVHIEEQLHAVHSDTHDLLPGLEASAGIAASQNRILEAGPDLIVRRMHGTMMVPDPPGRIPRAIVA